MDDIKAIIPARSGSKGIRNKNVRPFAGKSLLGYAVDFCIEVDASEIILSTDNDEYFGIVDSQCSVSSRAIRIKKHKRSHVSSNDQATDFDVLQEIYNDGFISTDDLIVWIRPTSPLRCPDEFFRAKENFVSKFNGKGSLRSIKPSATHPYWMKKFDSESESITPFIEGCEEKSYPNRQSLPPSFEITSEYDFLYVREALEQQVFLPSPMRGFITDTMPKVDIDNVEEFYLAEQIFLAYKRENS